MIPMTMETAIRITSPRSGASSAMRAIPRSRLVSKVFVLDDEQGVITGDEGADEPGRDHPPEHPRGYPKDRLGHRLLAVSEQGGVAHRVGAEGYPGDGYEGSLPAGA